MYTVVIVPTSDIEAASSPKSSGMLTYSTAIFASLMIVAIVVIIALVCYYRKRVRQAAGVSVKHGCILIVYSVQAYTLRVQQMA